MKTIFKIFLTAVACAAVLSACTQQAAELGSSVGVSLESIVFAGTDAESVNVTVTAEGEWLAVAPEWLTVSPNYGTGNMTVSITAADNLDADGTLAAARSGSVSFEVNGAEAVISVSQEGDPDKAPAEIRKITVAEFLAAAEGPDFYELTGTITSIANTTYGNFYIDDGTGSVYCYGLLTKEGGESQKFASLGLAVGDLLTLHGTRSSHNGTPQIGGAYYVSHIPSLLSVGKTEYSLEKEAGTFCVATVVKGDVLLAVPDASWIKMSGMMQDGDTTRVMFSYTENDTQEVRTANIALSSVRYGETEEDNQTTTINVSVTQNPEFSDYVKAAAIVSGSVYIIVSDGNAATAVPEDDKYGYLKGYGVSVENDVASNSNPDCEFVFTGTEGGYVIQDHYGRYLYQDEEHNSFNVSDELPESGHVWTVSIAADGSATIKNAAVSKFIQYDTQHASFGSYSEAGESLHLPVLYEKQAEE